MGRLSKCVMRPHKVVIQGSSLLAIITSLIIGDHPLLQVELSIFPGTRPTCIVYIFLSATHYCRVDKTVVKVCFFRGLPKSNEIL